MSNTASTIQECCQIGDVGRGRGHIVERFTTAVATLGRECREWPDEYVSAEVYGLIEEVSRPGEAVIFIDGYFLLMGVKCQSRWTARQGRFWCL